MIKVYCDRCGKELPKDRKIFYMNSWIQYDGAQQKSVDFEADLCDECWQQLIPQINNIGKELKQKKKYIEQA